MTTIICKRCKSDEIDICPNDIYPFYCNSCNAWLDHNNIIQLNVLSIHYAGNNLYQLLTTNKPRKASTKISKHSNITL